MKGGHPRRRYQADRGVRQGRRVVPSVYTKARGSSLKSPLPRSLVQPATQVSCQRVVPQLRLPWDYRGVYKER